MSRALLPLALLLTGCPSVGPEPTVFWTDVAPLVQAHCAECHQEGGIAPFRLDNYEDAAIWASTSAQMVAARTMPPFSLVDDGSCGDWQDAHWLSDEEIGLFQTWASEGAAEGEGATVTPPTPATLSGATTDTQTPDFLPEIVGGDYAEFDEYRCFAVQVPTTTETFLTGYEVLPGNEAIVHHVIGMPVDLAGPSERNGMTNQEVIDALRAPQPDRDGWPCFNGAGEDVRFEFELVAWAPGQGAVTYPEGTGLSMPAGTTMVYQVHYNLANASTIGQRDQTTVRLRLEDAVEQEAYISLPDGFLGGISAVQAIPPGEEAASVTYEFPIRWLSGSASLDFNLIGVLPHMHQRGRAMHVSLAHEDGAESCMFEVRDWDFAWQRMYMRETPMLVRGSDVLQVECVYDTRGDTEPTTPGWGTQNEMCLPGLLVTLAL